MITNTYRQHYEDGMKYQDFIAHHLNLCCYSSRENQYAKGENTLGMEIKYDNRLEETENIYIEVAEKTNKDNEAYVVSGINNPIHWLYLIGNYKLCFIFSSKFMRGFITKYPDKFRKVQTDTSIGYLINLEDSKRLCVHKIYF